MIFDLEPVHLMASSASCLMVNSPGLPMFTGPMVCCPDEGGADASKQQATPLGARLCRSGGWNRAPAAHLLVHQPDEPVDQVVDVAEGARLLALAVDGDVLALDRLRERGQARASAPAKEKGRGRGRRPAAG